MFTSKVEALSATISLECNEEVNAGDKITCDVNMDNISGSVYGLKFNYQLDDKITFESFKLEQEEEIINNETGLVLVNEDGIESSTKIGTLTLATSTSAGDGIYNIKLSNIDISDVDNDYYTSALATVKITGGNVTNNPKTGVNMIVINILIILSVAIMIIYQKRRVAEV